MNKLKRIDQLIKKARQEQDNNALLELCILFNPLIVKISKIIYIRYEKQFQFEEILEQAKQLFICLTLMDFIIDGRARFPYFIKQFIHAELVRIYRPLYHIRMASISIEEKQYVVDKLISCSAMAAISKNEKRRLYNRIYRYIYKYFTPREIEILETYIYDHTPKKELANKHNISATRIRSIYKKCLSRLRIYLRLLGIRKEDI